MFNQQQNLAVSESMFTSIHLKNFKCYRDSGVIPLAPLTLIVGPNNSGKSSVLQALSLLSQTARDESSAALVTSGPLVDAGGFHDIHNVHAPRTRPTFSIAITREAFERIESDREGQHFSGSNSLFVEFGFDSGSNQIFTRRTHLSDSEGSLIKMSRTGRWKSRFGSSTDDLPVKFVFRNFLPFLVPVEKSQAKGGKRKLTASQQRAYSNITMLDIQSFIWSNVLDAMRHIAPLRTKVPWYYGTGRRSSSDLGPGGENVVRAIAGHPMMPGSSKEKLDTALDHWMSDKLELVRRIWIDQIGSRHGVYSLLAQDAGGTDAINVAGMGEGISQVLPIVVRSLLSPHNECLLIEQPEVHLHPRAQANLGDLFVETASRNQRQVIIETHSEHLLLRIRRRVAEGKIKPSKVSILFVEKNGKESTIRPLELNRNGHFNDWPEGFFEDAYREAMELAMAQPTKRVSGD